MAGKHLQEAINAIRAGDKDTGARLLADLLNANPRNKSAWLWMVYAVDDIERKRDALERVLALNQWQLDACLLSYDYPELQGITERVRRDFAFSVAWDHSCQDLIWDGANEPLAVVLGTDYVLDVDVEKTIRDLFGTPSTSDTSLPISYEQRTELWPDLASLQALSLPARKVFVRAMQMVQVRSGFVEYYTESFFTDRLVCISGFDDALHELAEGEFVDLHPKPSDLLMSLTGKDLKQFAYDRGLKPRGSKYELIQEIVANVAHDAIEALLNEKLKDDRQYIRVTVDNFPLLKKYVWAEIHRLGLYVGWVQSIHCQRRSPGEVVYEPSRTVADAPPDRDPDMEPWARWDDNPSRGWKRTELRLVRGIWDSGCDEIVKELAGKYAWDAPWYFSDAIVAHLLPDKLEQFKQACENNETRSWYNLLMYYGQMRLAKMKVKIRQPQSLACADCGKKFLESSVPVSIARRVDHRVHFCRDCYGRAFWEVSRSSVTLSQEDMLDRLTALAVALEGVPSATFVQNPTTVEFSDEKQIAVVKALLHMPSHKAYVDTFDSWLRALVLAGILEDGTQRMARGTRCVASDGHECLSLSEKTVDDWLSWHGILHEKEPCYPYDPELNPAGMRADWEAKGTLIEYAGMMDEPEYAAKMKTKKKLCVKFNLPLIILEPEDVLSLNNKLACLLDE
jgi:hypothetical protein